MPSVRTSTAAVHPSEHEPAVPATRRQRIDAERSAARHAAEARRAAETRRAAEVRRAGEARHAVEARSAAAASGRVRGSSRTAVAGPAAPVPPVTGRVARGVTGVATLAVAAGLVVATSVPAQAFWSPAQVRGRTVVPSGGPGQSLTVAGSATDADAGRDDYTVTDATKQYAHTSDTFTNDPDGAVQWPFLTGVPITSGFGGRAVAGCSFCSTFHEGADFAPGAGTPIRVIADGTVTRVRAGDGGYGNDVWVQHEVDGARFVSVYGHMADGSFRVVPGQRVAVGDELGLVGSTGNSTGPHLHLEVHVDGVPVDPIAWLRTNAD